MEIGASLQKEHIHGKYIASAELLFAPAAFCTNRKEEDHPRTTSSYSRKDIGLTENFEAVVLYSTTS